MSSGKPKAKKASFAPASSVFQGIDKFNVELGGLGSANVTRNPNQSIDMTGSLSSTLGQSRDLASEGLGNNLAFINRTPTQQLEDLSAGKNSFYNLQSELNKRLAETQLGQAQHRFSSNGLENSTVRGSFEGQLATDAALQDLATRQSALEFQGQQALQNIASQNQTLGNLATIQQIPLQMAQQNAMQAFGNVDQNSQFNSGQQNQVSMFNADAANKMAMQAAQNRSALMGNLISAGASLAAIPLTGGLSGLGALKGATSVAGALGNLSRNAMPALYAPNFSNLSVANPFVRNRIQ
jgi:hypothetical protein